MPDYELTTEPFSPLTSDGRSMESSKVSKIVNRYTGASLQLCVVFFLFGIFRVQSTDHSRLAIMWSVTLLALEMNGKWALKKFSMFLEKCTDKGRVRSVPRVLPVSTIL